EGDVVRIPRRRGGDHDGGERRGTRRCRGRSGGGETATAAGATTAAVHGVDRVGSHRRPGGGGLGLGRGRRRGATDGARGGRLVPGDRGRGLDVPGRHVLVVRAAAPAEGHGRPAREEQGEEDADAHQEGGLAVAAVAAGQVERALLHDEGLGGA